MHTPSAADNAMVWCVALSFRVQSFSAMKGGACVHVFSGDPDEEGTADDGPRAVLMMNVWHPALVGDVPKQMSSVEKFAAQQSHYAAGASLGTVG